KPLTGFKQFTQATATTIVPYPTKLYSFLPYITFSFELVSHIIDKPTLLKIIVQQKNYRFPPIAENN
ncbi:MAG: hypothetical protein IJI61_10295, partial [Oscillospiraceae bacterium]|nr:hypothetical protein [Oscillospiraceae bacterium]